MSQNKKQVNLFKQITKLFFDGDFSYTLNTHHCITTFLVKRVGFSHFFCYMLENCFGHSTCTLRSVSLALTLTVKVKAKIRYATYAIDCR